MSVAVQPWHMDNGGLFSARHLFISYWPVLTNLDMVSALCHPLMGVAAQPIQHLAVWGEHSSHRHHRECCVLLSSALRNRNDTRLVQDPSLWIWQTWLYWSARTAQLSKLCQACNTPWQSSQWWRFQPRCQNMSATAQKNLGLVLMFSMILWR